jgi:hypothetical protein
LSQIQRDNLRILQIMGTSKKGWALKAAKTMQVEGKELCSTASTRAETYRVEEAMATGCRIVFGFFAEQKDLARLERLRR